MLRLVNQLCELRVSGDMMLDRQSVPPHGVPDSHKSMGLTGFGVDHPLYVVPAGVWANCLTIVSQKAGRSFGERLVIRLPSTTTSSSTT